MPKTSQTHPTPKPAAKSAARPLYMGPRLKRLRRELGLTQQTMADELEISGSYVALLERNQRPVTAELLLRIVRSYQLDIADLAVDDSADYARRLGEVLRDPIFADIDLPALEVADLAASFPGVSEALLRVYGAYTREAAALADRGEGAPDVATGLDAVAEVRRYLAAHHNFFATLDARAEAIAAAIAEAGDTAAYLARHHGIRTRLLPAHVMMGAIRRFDRHNQQLLLDDTLGAASRAFHMALQVAYAECRADIAALVREAQASSPTAQVLLRRALADYVAAAILMPYDRFARAVEERAYDIEALSRLFGTSFEQTARRQRLQAAGRGGLPLRDAWRGLPLVEPARCVCRAGAHGDPVAGIARRPALLLDCAGGRKRRWRAREAQGAARRGAGLRRRACPAPRLCGRHGSAPGGGDAHRRILPPVPPARLRGSACGPCATKSAQSRAAPMG